MRHYFPHQFLHRVASPFASPFKFDQKLVKLKCALYLRPISLYIILFMLYWLFIAVSVLI